MSRHLRTRTPKIGRDDRCHVMVSLTPEEADRIVSAADGLPVATWLRWAGLQMARGVSATAPKGLGVMEADAGRGRVA